MLRFAIKLLVLTLSAIPARGQAVDYARDVLPILSDKCYHCHGPDEHARKAKLQLDEKESAFRNRDGVTVITPGDAGASELVRRITSPDPDEQMPPPDDIRKLSPEQIATLRRWVEQGAIWGTHWAYVAPAATEAPTVDEGVQDPVDAFVLKQLHEHGRRLSQEADKATLLRRVSFDLTGLPPTPEEIDAFLADASPDAYEKCVDRLLASPRYGERMATDWLDLARYADTHGYQMDRYRPTWPWRDWVIKAFNDNLPYDEFIRWQLAGDLLPNAMRDQILATAFNRQHMQNEEGGIVPEEFRVAYVVDRVNTFGTAFLGLTFECARCHDHKFDPITQRDFYSLFAFFQNIDESGQTSYFTDATPTPTLMLSTVEQDTELQRLRSEVKEKERDLRDALADAATLAGFERWLNERSDDPPGAVNAQKHYNFEDLAAIDAQSIEGPLLVDGKMGKAVQLNGDNGFTFPGVGQFTRADPFSIALWLRTPASPDRAVVLHKSKAFNDAAGRGYELLLENGRVSFGLLHFWPGNALKVATRQPVEVGQWIHITVTYDGSSRAAGVRVFINGEPAKIDVIRDGLTRDITYGNGEPDLTLGHRFRDSGFKGGQVDELYIFDRALTSLEVTQLAGRDDLNIAWSTGAIHLSTQQRTALRDLYGTTADGQVRQRRDELRALRRAENALASAIPEMMVMRELATPKKAFILDRGAYDAHGEEVSAATPAFLPPMSEDLPRNRLGLAHWLLDPANPLTARVTVNRAWQQMFGYGIVETSDNVGVQGAQPTHPELLDWLARSFADDMGWDMKQLLRTIALSVTYRQSSRATAEQIASDPTNALLARGPARRLTAEMLRDQALNVSGLLVGKIGGPSVKPYQPDGLWSVGMGNPQYDQSTGEGLYRRSLYTFWKRTIPPPAMMTFDAADRSNCSAKRKSTSTPLQALALLNDPQIVEAARFVSHRMLTEGGVTTAERVTWAFRAVTGRRASAPEREVLVKLYDEQKALFAADETAVAALLGVGEKPNDLAIDKADLAAGTVLAIALFNHDAAIMRR